MTRASQESFSANGGRMIWGRKDEEYVADFSLVTRRTLSAEEYRIFKYHFLLGADWNLCCRRLNIERKSFFHIVYRIEQRLGRVFRELKPYALFPVDEYFQSSSGVRMRATYPEPKVVPIRPPSLALLEVAAEEEDYVPQLKSA